jgi:hypothetical protein
MFSFDQNKHDSDSFNVLPQLFTFPFFFWLDGLFCWYKSSSPCPRKGDTAFDVISAVSCDFFSSQARLKMTVNPSPDAALDASQSPNFGKTAPLSGCKTAYSFVDSDQNRFFFRLIQY